MRKKSTQKTDFDALFKEKFGRTPSEEDKKTIGMKIILAGESSRPEAQYSLSDVVDNHLAAVNEQYSVVVDENKVEAIINRLAQDETQKKEEERRLAEEERRNKEQRKKTVGRFFGKLGAVAALGVFIGVAGGTGFAVYQAGKDYFVKRSIAEYEEKKNALDQRFFGPLEKLLEKMPVSEFTSLETNLYTQANLGIDIARQLADQSNLLYDQTINGVRIVAKNVVIGKGEGGKGRLLLLKMADSKVTAAYSYNSCYSCSPLSDAVTEADDPLMTITFSTDYLMVVDYDNKFVKKIMRVGNLAYKGEENIDVYKENATEILAEFRNLYSRGPNAESKTQ